MKTWKTDQCGFTTVWLVMILSSLVFLLLVIAEAASGFACRSICENACACAGQSILSEYNKALYDYYGVFALRANDSRLSGMASYYIGSSIRAESCLVRPELTECTVMTDSHSLLSAEHFQAQIRDLGVQSGLYTAAVEISLNKAFSGLLEASEYSASLDESSISSLKKIKRDSSDKADSLRDEASELSDALEKMKDSENYDSAEADRISDDISRLKDKADDAEKEAEQSEKLIKRYNSALNPDFECKEAEISIDHASASELPSRILEVGETVSLILSGGITELDTDAAFCGEYILNSCSNFQKDNPDSFLKGEAEYILYGYGSEEQNLAALKRSLFSIRFPVNLASLYADPAKLSEFSVSAAAFLPVPVSLTVFVLACIEASAEALDDIEKICSGQRVPLLENGSGGTYSDYLRILLLFLPQEAKMIRLMDIMQLNLNKQYGEAFKFRDFSCGLSIIAEFDEAVRVSVIDIPSIRKGQVTMEAVYK